MLREREALLEEQINELGQEMVSLRENAAQENQDLLEKISIYEGEIEGLKRRLKFRNTEKTAMIIFNPGSGIVDVTLEGTWTMSDLGVVSTHFAKKIKRVAAAENFPIDRAKDKAAKDAETTLDAENAAAETAKAKEVAIDGMIETAEVHGMGPEITDALGQRDVPPPKEFKKLQVRDNKNRPKGT